MTRRTLAPLALAFALALAGPALASEASEAYKQAKELEKAVSRARDDAAEAEAKVKLEDFCKSAAERLAAGKLSKMDMLYLGYVQSYGGMHDAAVATMRQAVADPAETKFGANVHAGLVDALVAKGDLATALEEVRAMRAQYQDHKLVKTQAMKVGLGLRGARDYAKSAEALELSLAMNDLGAAKTLVNDYLLLGQQDKAVATAERAVEMATGPDKAEMETVLAITRKVGQPMPLDFAAFVPAGAPPELAGKVVVLGFWNVSARTLEWTMGVLKSIHSGFGASGVETLAVTTYYKKDAETGQMDEAMPPEKEHEVANLFRSQYGYTGAVAFARDEAALKEMGLSGLPYFMVVGKDGKLLFAHVVNPASGSGDVELLRDTIEKATQ